MQNPQSSQGNYPTFNSKHNSVGGFKSPKAEEVFQNNGRQIV
jgi:hypothetical protein